MTLSESIAFHAPRVRLLDSAIGGGVGALAGLGTAAVRNWNTDDSQGTKRKRYLTHALAGAAAGAGVGNLVGDRGRRYLANSVSTVHYGSADQLKQLRPQSWGQLSKRLISDEMALPDDKSDRLDVAARELWRRSMDLPVRDGIFAPVGDNTVGFNPDALDRAKDLDLNFLLGRYTEEPITNVTPRRKLVRITDRYDFDLHDHEKKVLPEALRAVLRGDGQKDMTDIADNRYGVEGFRRKYTASNLLRSLLMRQASQMLLGTDGGVKLDLRTSHGGSGGVPEATPIAQ